MAPRVPPPKKNRARCGIKYPLKIIKGDFEGPEDHHDHSADDHSLMVADVDVHEGQEHHLWTALSAQKIIPTPPTFTNVVNYEELYPPNTWKDPVSYLQTTRTVEESCTNALLDHQYTYFMDEVDARWLGKNNQGARGEGTSEQGKEVEMGVPFSITEDEFELVMGLFEKFTDQLQIPGGDFSSYERFFSEPLCSNVFSYPPPSWIPVSALLVRIARAVFPHWKYRRSLVQGRKIQPSLNHDEYDFLSESYVCFRRRDDKPVRKTRAGQLVNHAEKLAQLDLNMSRALDIAKALLKRETFKKSAALQSQRVWNLRKSLVDLISTSPNLLNKADESILVEKVKKKKAAKSSLPKVKVVLTSNPGFSVAARCAEIQQEIARSVHTDSLRDQLYVDAVDAPYQTPLVPWAEKLWAVVPTEEEQCARNGSRALRLRYGRGGRRFVDRRSSVNPRLPLLSHRKHSDDERDKDYDEEDDIIRRLEARWRFDADDCPAFGAPEEQQRELYDEYDTKYLVANLTGKTNKEALLLTDASITLPGPDGRERTMLPFILNALSAADILGKHYMSYIKETWGSNVVTPYTSSAEAAVSRPIQHEQQKVAPAQSHSALLHSRPTSSPSAPATRIPTIFAPPRMQENISPPVRSGTQTASTSAHAPSQASLPRPSPRTSMSNPASPRNSNPIVVMSPTDVDKNIGPLNQNHVHVQARPLQNNGVRMAVLPHVASTIASRVPRPSPLALMAVAPDS